MQLFFFATLPTRAVLSCALALLLFSSGALTSHAASPTLIARAGDPADGAATFGSFSLPVINASGEVAFLGALQAGVNSVSADNDTGVWTWNSGATALISREGVSSVPGAIDAQFDSYESASLGVSGGLLVHGKLKSGIGGVGITNQDGIWDLGVSNSQLVRTNETAPAGEPSSSFTSLGGPMFAGTVAATPAQLQLGPTVNSSTNKGIWTYSSQLGSSLVARTQVTGAPGLSNGLFSNLALQDVNESQQTALLGVLEVGVGGVTAADRLGVWRLDSTGGVLVARQGSPAAGVSASAFESFGTSAISSAGLVSLNATLKTGGDVTTANNSGLWQHDGSTLSLVAREGDSASGVPSAVFSDFASLSINDAGQTLVEASLEISVGGVTAADASGLWLMGASLGQSHLVARLGSGEVPDVANADFKGFETWAINSLGQVALSAELASGTGGVNSSNDQGIWLVDPAGDSILVAREGDVIAGETISALSFAGGHRSGSRGLSDRGDLVFHADFASGGSGLFVYESPNELLSADFDLSSAVDGNDLSIWQSSFSSNVGGDANNDGITDGADLLLWQQQFSPLGQLSSVPEPATTVLISLGCLLLPYRRTCQSTANWLNR